MLVRLLQFDLYPIVSHSMQFIMGGEGEMVYDRMI